MNQALKWLVASGAADLASGLMNTNRAVNPSVITVAFGSKNATSMGGQTVLGVAVWKLGEGGHVMNGRFNRSCEPSCPR